MNTLLTCTAIVVTVTLILVQTATLQITVTIIIIFELCGINYCPMITVCLEVIIIKCPKLPDLHFKLQLEREREREAEHETNLANQSSDPNVLANFKFGDRERFRIV